MSIMFAAMFPDRTAGLILLGSAASFVPRPDDHPWGILPRAEWLQEFVAKWGTSETVTLDGFAPSVAQDEAYRRWWSHYERQSASPSALLRLAEMSPEIDVRAFLELVRAPTLVLHRRGDQIFPSNAVATSPTGSPTPASSNSMVRTTFRPSGIKAPGSTRYESS